MVVVLCAIAHRLMQITFLFFSFLFATGLICCGESFAALYVLEGAK